MQSSHQEWVSPPGLNELFWLIPLEITRTSIFPHQTCFPYTKGISDEIIVPREDVNGLTSGQEWGQSYFTSLGEEGWHLDNVCTLQEACSCDLANTQLHEGNQKRLGQSIQVAWAVSPFQRAVPKLSIMRRDVRRSALQLFLGNCETFFNTQKDRVCPSWTSGCPNHLSLHQYLQPWDGLRHSWILHPLVHSSCDPWPSTIHVTWELVRRPSTQIIGLQEERTG